MRQQESGYCIIIVLLTLIIRLLCIGSNELLAEEAYYWNYSAHLDIGYLDHPPMVGLLIKLFTMVFGTNEFGVRFASIVCWLATALFSFKLTNLIKQGAGVYAVMLLAILPFFFVHSLVITPDIPLILCWSAALYYLYRALVLDNPIAWYGAGIWLGLGMLSKYSIVLLGLATLVYLIMVPQARKWFWRKEPYICLVVTILLFTPVIYWNATHEWASFAFQSTRRLQATFSFTFHELLGLLVVFLTPLGIIGLWSLFRKKSVEKNRLDVKSCYFIQIFTLVPLIVFSVFSVSHAIKFNWIGPGLLAIVPWLAILMMDHARRRAGWFITAIILLIIYSMMVVCIISGRPVAVNRELFSKYISWSDLTQQTYAIAFDVEQQLKTTPLIVPLDLYNISSELSFYQAKFLATGAIPKAYKVIGRDAFGHDSLMYRYWSEKEPITGKTLLLITENPHDIDAEEVSMRVIAKSAIKQRWAHSQGAGGKIRKYYYKVVQMK